jgi:hypothetical protein
MVLREGAVQPAALRLWMRSGAIRVRTPPGGSIGSLGLVVRVP